MLIPSSLCSMLKQTNQPRESREQSIKMKRKTEGLLQFRGASLMKASLQSPLQRRAPVPPFHLASLLPHTHQHLETVRISLPPLPLFGCVIL